MKCIYTNLVIALLLALCPTARASTVWYVDGVSGSDSNSCTSPTHRLQDTMAGTLSFPEVSYLDLCVARGNGPSHKSDISLA